MARSIRSRQITRRFLPDKTARAGFGRDFYTGLCAARMSNACRAKLLRGASHFDSLQPIDIYRGVCGLHYVRHHKHCH